MSGEFNEEILGPAGEKSGDLDWAEAMLPIAERGVGALRVTGGAVRVMDHYLAEGFHRPNSTPNQQALYSAQLLKRANPSVVASCALDGASILPVSTDKPTSLSE